MARVTLTSPSRDAIHQAAAKAHQLADRLPRLTLEARRIAATVSAGLHGRRRAGQGETFWQYRALAEGETISAIDWRRSARHADQLYVREREWEAAHSVFIAIDRSASMRFRSALAGTTKEDRAIVLGLALADCLVKAGERVALFGLTRPIAHTNVIDRFAQMLAQNEEMMTDIPERPALPPRAEYIVISDFLMPIDQLRAGLEHNLSHHITTHFLRILDPAEELFPFEGETELIGIEDRERLAIGDAARFAPLYKTIFQAHADEISTLCRKTHASFLTHRTDRSAADALHALAARITGSHDAYQR